MAFVLITCKKQDSDPPTVAIIQPTQDTFSYGASIPIELSVNDNVSIDEIRVSIRHRDTQAQVLETLIFTENNSGSYTGQIQFNDIHVETGSYYIQVIANDGENEGAAIKNIQLIGAPLELTAVFGFNNEASSTAFFELSGDSWVSRYTLPIRSYQFIISSYFQQLLIAGSSSQGLMSFATQNGYLSGQSQGLYIGETLWNASHYDEQSHWWWLACKDGSIRAFNAYAEPRTQFQTPGNFIPHAITTTSDRVITSSSNAENTMHRLDIFVKSTGQLIQSLSLSERIQLIATLNDDRVWTYANDAEVQQKIYLFDGHYLDEWSNFRNAPSGQILQVIRSDNRLFMRYNDTIRSFSSNGLLLSEATISSSAMQYEKLNDVLYVRNDSWKILNSSNLQELSNIPNPLNLTNVVFLYNK